MINILITFIGLQLMFVILRGTKVGKMIYILGRIGKQMIVLNYNILRFIFKQTKEANKKLKNKYYSKQNKNKKVNYKKVANGDNVINFKNYKRR